MINHINIYYHVKKFDEKFILYYLIHDTNGKPLMKIRKKLKSDSLLKSYYHGLYYILKDIVCLIELKKINKYSEILIITDCNDIVNKINNKYFLKDANFEYISFFLNQIYKYNSKLNENSYSIIMKSKKVSFSLYKECKNIGKTYKKLINRNSTLVMLQKYIEDSEEIIFFDFEMNCLENFNDVEIISIGAVKTDIYGNINSKFYEFIKPKCISKLTPKCIEITSLTQNDINNAKSFETVFKEFSYWCGNKNKLFMYWGGNDIRVLKNDINRNSSKLNILNTLLKNNLDFQEILCKDLLEIENFLSLKNALTKYNIDFLGKQHDSLFDSINLAILYKYSMNSHLK